jgi:small subunit ribosomal protein S8
MDGIANMINGLQNAGRAHKETVSIPYSIFKDEIAKALTKAGYIKTSRKVQGEGAKVQLELVLEYKNKDHVIHGARRISKPSKRVYMGVRDIRPVKFGSGALLFSTPKGILTDKEARKEMVGGEALFEIW